MDRRHKLVRRYHVSDAAEHDSQVLDDILDGDNTALGVWADILCAQEDRVVAGDNTVRYKNRTLQIPADRHRHHYVKAQVRVHEYPDGPARYRADGETIDDDRLQAA